MYVEVAVVHVDVDLVSFSTLLLARDGVAKARVHVLGLLPDHDDVSSL